MIKGVSKKIVEINYTNDDYVEKAILIMNPEKSDLPERVLEDRAREFLKKVSPSKKKKRRLRPSAVLIFGVSFILIGAICLIICLV